MEEEELFYITVEEQRKLDAAGERIEQELRQQVSLRWLYTVADGRPLFLIVRGSCLHPEGRKYWCGGLTFGDDVHHAAMFRSETGAQDTINTLNTRGLTTIMLRIVERRVCERREEDRRGGMGLVPGP
jgi:hypothetical protein